MEKKYRVLFHGLMEADEDLFKAGMVRLGAPPGVVEKMLRKTPVVLKGDMTLGDARRYADAVQGAGGRVTIKDHGYFEESKRMNRSTPIASFQQFTMCPECGLKQPKGEKCVKCGFDLVNGK